MSASQQIPMSSDSHLNKPCYFQGKVVALKDANVNIQTHALQYGTACFGGVRGYYNKEQDNLFVFRVEDHFTRLKKSAHLLQMRLKLDVQNMISITLDLLRQGEWRQNVYIRPIVYKSALELSPRLHNVDDDLSIYVLALNDYLDTKKGLSACVSSYTRIHDNQISPRAKATGAYINSALAKSEALQNNFDEAIFLDQGGYVSEGSAEIIFTVRDNKLITPSLGSSILDSITRRAIITMAKDLGIEVEECLMTRSDLYLSDEAFFAGTGVQIAWINSIDHLKIGNGEIGPITKRLQDLFFETVTKQNPKYSHWLTAVY